MPGKPVVRRGGRLFCPECGHMMTREYDKCPNCGVEFEGVVEEVQHDARHLASPEEMELGDEIQEMGKSYRVRTAIIALAFVLAALFLYLIICR